MNFSSLHFFHKKAARRYTVTEVSSTAELKWGRSQK